MDKNNNRYDFCRLRNSSGGGDRAELFFYGDIVSDSWGAWTDEDQYPDNVRTLIADIGDRDVDIRINSGGGDVFAGCAICNLLRSLPGAKTVYIDGVAASIASIIAMAGDKIVMPENAQLMIHKPFLSYFMRSCNADELRKDADTLDHIEESLIATYMTRTTEGITEEKLSDMLREETWFSAKQAAEVFSTVEIAAPVQAAAHIDSKFFDKYKNTPKSLLEKKSDEPDPEELPFTEPPPDDMSEYEEYLALSDQLFANYE